MCRGVTSDTAHTAATAAFAGIWKNKTGSSASLAEVGHSAPSEFMQHLAQGTGPHLGKGP